MDTVTPSTIMREAKRKASEGLRQRNSLEAMPSAEEIAEAQRQYDEVVARYTNPDGTKKPGWMMAPNGKPTNLTERQWVMVRTPNFKRWFGDWENDPENASKVLDENGEPLVVYHGTTPEKFGFTEFNTDVRNTNYGAHFGDAEAASGFDPTGKSTYSVFLNIRKPYETGDIYARSAEENAMTLWSLALSNGDARSAEIASELEEKFPWLKDAPKNADMNGDGYEWILDNVLDGDPDGGDYSGDYEEEFFDMMRELLQIGGYDGMMYRNAMEGQGISWVALRPAQIKSATDNIGTYDGNKNHTRYSVEAMDDGNPSIQARTAKEIDEQDGTQLEEIFSLINAIKNGASRKDHYEHFRLAKTSNILKQIGIQGDYLTIGAKVIFSHFNKDEDHILTEQDWTNISDALNDPLVVAKYSIPGKNGKRFYPKNTFSIWVEAVINGHYARVGIEIKSPAKGLFVNAVSTIFGDEFVTISSDDIVYSRNNEEGVRTLLDGPNPRRYSEPQLQNQIVAQSSSNVNRNSWEVSPAEDAEYLDAVKRGDMDTAQRMVNEAAKRVGAFKRNAGESTYLHVPSAINEKTREIVDFVQLMLDKIKGGETRSLDAPKLPVGKWLGLEEDGLVYGKVKFGNPIVITNKSPEYQNARIDGTIYGLKDGESKLYYPVTDVVDMRDNPRPRIPKRNSATYGTYQEKLPDPVTYDNNGEVIPLSQRFNLKRNDVRYSVEGMDDARFSVAPADYNPGKTYHDITGRYLYKMKRVVDGHLEYPMSGTGIDIPMGRWLIAEDMSSVDKKTGKRITKLRFGSQKVGKDGKLKSSSGTAAPYPGFHMGTHPYMAHIGLGGTPGQKHFMNAPHFLNARPFGCAEIISACEVARMLRAFVMSAESWRDALPSVRST